LIFLYCPRSVQEDESVAIAVWIASELVTPSARYRFG
jgi:hypothetical protein